MQKEIDGYEDSSNLPIRRNVELSDMQEFKTFPQKGLQP